MVDTDSVERISWRNISVIIFGLAIWGPFVSAINIYWDVFLYELGATPIIISLIAMVSGTARLVASIYGGYLADRFGRRKIIVSMSYVLAMVYLLFYFAKTWIHILFIVIIFGLASIYYPALQAIIADSTPLEKRGRIFSIINLVSSLTSIVAPLIAYRYIESMGIIEGMRELFFLAFLTGALISTARLIFIEETLRTRHTKHKSILSSYREAFGVLRKRAVEPILFICIRNLMWGVIYLIQLYTMLYLGINYMLWAFIQMTVMILTAITSIPAGIITDRFGRRKTTIIGTIISLFGISCLAFPPRESAFIYVLCGLSLLAVTNVIIANAISTMVVDLIPPEIRGRGYATLGIIVFPVYICGVLIGGILYTLHPRIPFILAVFLVAITIIVSLMLPETLRRKNEHAQQSL